MPGPVLRDPMACRVSAFHLIKVVLCSDESLKVANVFILI